MYIQRTLENAIKQASNFFPIVLVTGPRQVGKTTIFENCESGNRNYISLDNLEIQEMARQYPQRFLERYKTPLVIDEIQYAPQLLPYIKIIADKEKKKGMYWLTGSQQFNLMANVTESLAGRVGILNLQGFSQSEKNKIPDAIPFLPDKKLLSQKEKNNKIKIFFIVSGKALIPLFLWAKTRTGIFFMTHICKHISKEILNK